MSAIVERSPLVGTVVAVKVAVGQNVAAGNDLVVIESMKMEHPVVASFDCVVVSVAVVVGQTVREGEELVHCKPSEVSFAPGFFVQVPPHSDYTHELQLS